MTSILPIHLLIIQSKNQPNAAAPPGTEHISDIDVVTVGANYLNYPSDNDLSELNFDMNKDQVIQVLENNG